MSSTIRFSGWRAWGGSAREQIAAHGQQSELETIAHMIFSVDRREDVPDRLLGQAEVVADLAIGSSVDDAAEDVTLARRQLVQPRRSFPVQVRAHV
jgi:hypothetical protein